MVLRRTKMNLGFYVDSIGESELNNQVYDVLEDGIINNKLEDASVFYNDVAFNPRTNNKFGIFNSTDIWSFTGTLVCEGLMNTSKALNIVNKFKPVYLYKKEQMNLLTFMDVASRTEAIAITEEDEQEFYRLTGKKPYFFKELSVGNIRKVSECPA